MSDCDESIDGCVIKSIIRERMSEVSNGGFSNLLEEFVGTVGEIGDEKDVADKKIAEVREEVRAEKRKELRQSEREEGRQGEREGERGEERQGEIEGEREEERERASDEKEINMLPKRIPIRKCYYHNICKSEGNTQNTDNCLKFHYHYQASFCPHATGI